MSFYNIQYSPVKENINNIQRCIINKKKIKIYDFRKIKENNYKLKSNLQSKEEITN